MPSKKLPEGFPWTDYLTTKEAAATLNIPLYALGRLLRANHFEYAKVGKQRRVSTDSVNRYIAKIEAMFEEAREDHPAPPIEATKPHVQITLGLLREVSEAKEALERDWKRLIRHAHAQGLAARTVAGAAGVPTKTAIKVLSDPQPGDTPLSGAESKRVIGPALLDRLDLALSAAAGASEQVEVPLI